MYIRSRNLNCWTIVFKFGSNIPFRNILDKFIGQKYPIICYPHFEGVLFLFLCTQNFVYFRLLHIQSMLPYEGIPFCSKLAQILLFVQFKDRNSLLSR